MLFKRVQSGNGPVSSKSSPTRVDYELRNWWGVCAQDVGECPCAICYESGETSKSWQEWVKIFTKSFFVTVTSWLAECPLIICSFPGLIMGFKYVISIITSSNKYGLKGDRDGIIIMFCYYLVLCNIDHRYKRYNSHHNNIGIISTIIILGFNVTWKIWEYFFNFPCNYRTRHVFACKCVMKQVCVTRIFMFRAS